MLANDKNNLSAFKAREEDACLPRAEREEEHSSAGLSLSLTGLAVNKGNIVCLLPCEVMTRKYQPKLRQSVRKGGESQSLQSPKHNSGNHSGYKNSPTKERGLNNFFSVRPLSGKAF